MLNNLSDEVKLAELVSPTLIIIGNVVALSPLWPQSSEGSVTSGREYTERRQVSSL